MQYLPDSQVWDPENRISDLLKTTHCPPIDNLTGTQPECSFQDLEVGTWMSRNSKSTFSFPRDSKFPSPALRLRYRQVVSIWLTVEGRGGTRG